MVAAELPVKVAPSSVVAGRGEERTAGGRRVRAERAVDDLERAGREAVIDGAADTAGRIAGERAVRDREHARRTRSLRPVPRSCPWPSCSRTSIRRTAARPPVVLPIAPPAPVDELLESVVPCTVSVPAFWTAPPGLLVLFVSVELAMVAVPLL